MSKAETIQMSLHYVSRLQAALMQPHEALSIWVSLRAVFTPNCSHHLA